MAARERPATRRKPDAGRRDGPQRHRMAIAYRSTRATVDRTDDDGKVDYMSLFSCSGVSA